MAQATTNRTTDQMAARGPARRLAVAVAAGLWVALLAVVALVPQPAHALEKPYPHIDPKTGYRMGYYRSALPDEAPGSTRVDAKTLKAMIDKGGIILLDVNAHVGAGYDPITGEWYVQKKRMDIPGSVWLPDVGAGYLTPVMERYFRENLEKLTGGDKAKPIVLYCQADCWMSWNASKRASSWGYSNLYWFPEGDAGWKDAGNKLVEAKPVPVPVD